MDINPKDLRPRRKLLGFQFENAGDDDDPSGLASFEVMTPRLLVSLLEHYPNQIQINIIPVYEDTIEEPVIVDLNDY